MKCFICTICLLQWFAVAPHAQVPDPEHTYPRDAHLVPVSNAANLQRELDTHKKIILEPKDYGDVGVTMRSGYEIYGLPGTRLLHVIVEGGTSHAVVSGISCGGLKFPKSDLVIKENLFFNIYTSMLKISEARLENNKFVDIFGKIIAETESTGYLRNNRFIRCTVHSAFPQLSLKGNYKYPSYGNVFLWFNFLSGHAENAVIEKQKSLTIAGVDAEIYSNGYSLFDVKEVENLTIVGVAGGDNKKDQVPLAKLNVDKALIYGMNIHTNDNIPHINISPKTKSLSMINSRNYNLKFEGGSTRFTDAFKSHDSILFNGASARDLSSDQKTELDDAMSFPTGKPWEVFEHDTSIPKRRPDSAVINDHTAYLQSLIDAKDVVLLDPGVYYISKPLILEGHQALIGWGKGKTVIRALSNDINMIQNQQRNGANEIIYRPKFNVAQLSLENGKNGIYYTANDDGTDQITVVNTFLSNVEFYNMSYAGIHLDYSNCEGVAFDNNLLDHLDFFKCKYGVKQTSVCDCPVWPCPYTDKTAFYRCRFIENGIGVDLTAKRQNNNNGWIECLFKNNEEIDLSLYANANPLIALCKFESPTTKYILKNAFRPLVLHSTINSGKSEASIFSGNASVHGVDIKANNAMLFSNPKWPMTLTNSTITGTVSMKNFGNGVLYNNAFTGDSTFSSKLVQFVKGVNTVIIDANSAPAPGILIDEYDCNGDVSGSAYIDDCGNCAGGETGIIANECDTEIKSSNTNISFKLYPNPTDGTLYLTHPGEWKIFNLNNVTLMKGTDQVIDVSMFRDGLYFLQVETEDLMLIEKFLIRK